MFIGSILLEKNISLIADFTGVFSPTNSDLSNGIKSALLYIPCWCMVRCAVLHCTKASPYTGMEELPNPQSALLTASFTQGSLFENSTHQKIQPMIVTIGWINYFTDTALMAGLVLYGSGSVVIQEPSGVDPSGVGEGQKVDGLDDGI